MSMTMTAAKVRTRPAAAVSAPAVSAPAAGPGRAGYLLATALAVTAAASALCTFLIPDILRGTAVMNGSARGTALVVTLLGVPVLACSLLLARRGSARAVLAWLGATGFLSYNALMFVFATPANRLFPLYLAMLAFALWSAAAALRQTDVRGIGGLFSAKAPVRAVAAYLWVIVAVNGTLWLVRIVRGVASAGQPGWLHGTGLTTNVVFVQDLAWWLPLTAIGAIWLWRGRRPWGYLIAAALLTMGPLESACIAVDQWYGHAADPRSAVVSATLVPAFAALAVIGLVPLYYLLRGFASSPGGVTAKIVIPAAGRRHWPAWAQAGLTLLTGALAVYGGIALIHDGFGMPLSWLSHTPVTTWTLPGIALLAGVAVPQLAACGMIAAAGRSALARRYALTASYLAGIALIAWIAAQLLVIQRYFFLQPVIAAIGLAEVALAARWQRLAEPQRSWRRRAPRRPAPVR